MRLGPSSYLKCFEIGHVLFLLSLIRSRLNVRPTNRLVRKKRDKDKGRMVKQGMVTETFLHIQII